MNKSINEKFIELVKENPDLPIKVFISGECQDEDVQWFAGDVHRCGVSEIALYMPLYGDCERYYEKSDIDDIIEDICERLCDEEEYADLPNEELDKIAKQKAEELEWQKVILIYVGV